MIKLYDINLPNEDISNIWSYAEALRYLKNKYSFVILNETLELGLLADLKFLSQQHGHSFKYKIVDNTIHIFDWKILIGGLDLFECSGIEEIVVDMINFDKSLIIGSQCRVIINILDLSKNIIFDFHQVENMTSAFISTFIAELHHLKGQKIKNYKFINLKTDIWQHKIEEAYRFCFDTEYQDHITYMYNNLK